MQHHANMVDILGVRITPIRAEEVLARIGLWVERQVQSYICACPNYSIMMAQRHSEFRKSLNEAAIAVPDGKAVAWACQLRGHRETQQVRGTDLMRNVMEWSVNKGYSHFLYGGAEGVPEQIADIARHQFPGIQIAGCYSPPFRTLTEQERKEVVRRINAANPDILWVGLGAPKQELWMAEYRPHLAVPVMVGVGAAFDFLCGKKREAPHWVQLVGLEWLFRLVREPRRLWRRNVVHPVFLAKVLAQTVWG